MDSKNSLCALALPEATVPTFFDVLQPDKNRMINKIKAKLTRSRA
ncbi:hypothetical protein F090043F1_42350 [Parabacteroides goldsteinii]